MAIRTAVYNQSGEKISELDLNPKIFGLEDLDAHLVHTAAVAQATNARHSIAHTKNRGEVAGSGKKPWKQKGTGRARAGSVRSPIWRHGGITFGPRNQADWSVKLNRSAFRKALFTILTDKMRDNKLTIIDKLPQVEKTRELAGILARIAANAGLGKNYSLILAVKNAEVVRAGRNLSHVKIMFADQLNILDLVQYDPIITQDALAVIEKIYLKNS
ncbi:MAG TPA: 50S ribosomal protein L4 [Patescibacteria group bacterium]|nr:50S ribosomal protein L4 [Patescibacteria group bacterium]